MLNQETMVKNFRRKCTLNYQENIFSKLDPSLTHVCALPKIHVLSIGKLVSKSVIFMGNTNTVNQKQITRAGIIFRNNFRLAQSGCPTTWIFNIRKHRQSKIPFRLILKLFMFDFQSLPVFGFACDKFLTCIYVIIDRS